MNPDSPKPSREEIEAKLTALLLGELPAEEAQLLRWAVSQDAALAQLHDRLKTTIGFVSEVAANPAGTIPAQTAPLKLSEARREKLLAHFKTIAPREFVPLVPPLKRKEKSWLMPLAAAAVVILVAAGLAALSIPNFIRARATSQANATINNLRQIDGAKQEWALENKKSPDAVPTPDDLKPYLVGGKLPPPVMGEKYVIGRVADPVVADVDARQARKSSSGLAGRLPSGLSSGQVVRLSVDGNLQVVDNSRSQVALLSPPPLAAPPAASEQRLESLEANFQNGNPPGNAGDAWKNQTTIVLPSDGTAGAELAAETPAPSANFNLGLAAANPSRDQDVFTVHMDNADPNLAPQVLQKLPGISAAETGPATAEPLATRERQILVQNNFQPPGNSPAVATDNRRSIGGGFIGALGGRGGGAGGGSTISGYADVSANRSAGELENKTLSGQVAVNDTGAQPVDRTRSFYRNIAPDSAADKKSGVPVLGSIPVLGNAFQQSSENNSFGAAVDNNGNIVLADDLSKFGNGAMTLKGYNAYNGVTTIGGGTLNVPVSAANPLGAFPGNTTVNGGALALNVEQEQADRVDTTTRLVQIEDGWQKSAAKDENHTVAFNNSGQINLGESVRQSDLPGALVQDGKLLYEMGKFNDSEAKLQDALKMDPNNQAANYYLNLAKQSSLARAEQKPAPGTQTAMLQVPISSPVAAPAAPLVSQMPAHRLPGDENDSRTPAPRVALLAPVTSATVVGYVNITNGIVLNQETKAGLQAQSATAEDRPLPKSPSPAPIPTPEMLTRENAFSTFSLNVSDVSFKLAAASLQRGQLPDAASIRSEEFLNAFDYRDPEPAAGVPVAFVAERARDPFAHNRDLLRFSIKTAAAGREPGRPLNIVLLLDNSGSMERADRVAIIHEALKVLASQLQPQDTLSIVTFARTARLWVDGARGDQAGTAVNKVSDLVPEGGTNLEEAMNLAYATARRHYLANGGNRVVLLTDGAANLGNVDPEALKQKVESFRKQGIALDCFGIGWEGYNDDLLEVLSSNGDGRYGFINTPEAATTEFAAQLAGALHVAAEDVKVQVEFNPARVISYRQIGYAKHQLTKEQFRDNTVAAAPLAAREAGNALYTVEINPQGEGPVATVRVRFRIPGTTDVSEHEWQVPFDGAAPALENSSPALRLAATAGAFSEWLASSPYAQEVTTDQLLNYLNGVPAIYGADARPKQLETMLREAKSISRK
jgi:Mg-chelatase subunit ChlD